MFEWLCLRRICGFMGCWCCCFLWVDYDVGFVSDVLFGVVYFCSVACGCDGVLVVACCVGYC